MAGDPPIQKVAIQEPPIQEVPIGEVPIRDAPASEVPIRDGPASEVPIRGETIRLGQLLKLAGVVQSGSEVKALLTREPLWVNDVRETRRGRQLHPGDAVRVAGQELRVTAAGG